MFTYFHDVFFAKKIFLNHPCKYDLTRKSRYLFLYLRNYLRKVWLKQPSKFDSLSKDCCLEINLMHKDIALFLWFPRLHHFHDHFPPVFIWISCTTQIGTCFGLKRHFIRLRFSTKPRDATHATKMRSNLHTHVIREHDRLNCRCYFKITVFFGP